ncbi:AbrB/MazE/SpoVT family DNA-binding domain-containing protein [Methanotorris igneus]|uniref:Transcriptional regulator, AbrB family n=1 Tax=Methanotorris igneus (strain DSM 5666 / JCM 11834 / Kol 5) TaxID=880724 RepID=F6BEI2_METIK|nr:AbrB/MazE/SpoVT family DNA-binding domain-containing protein [Methanotorris igneus]AEF95643.1 transcriptional regulator, AbrB family [Methanotorris igneus Kol 5]
MNISVSFTQKIDKKGKITIPASIRKKFNLETDDLVEVEIKKVFKKDKCYENAE